MIRRIVAALFLLLVTIYPATAQWQVPAHAVPVGRGAGVVGFTSATVGTAGRILVDQGGSADPAFKAVSGDCTVISTGAITCSTFSVKALSGFSVSGSSAATTGTVSAGSASLILAASNGFVDGQGIRINHAGAAYGGTPPSSLVVTPTGTTGATSYTYTIAPLTSTGGVGPAIATVTTATGNATLTSSNYNRLTWSIGGGVVAYAIYGSTSGCTTTCPLLAVVAGGAFNDIGAGAVAGPDWVPTTNPASSLANWLITSVSSGGGTTSITLGTTATTAATAQVVAHDDTVGLQAWLDACAAGSHYCFLNTGTYNITSALNISTSLTIAGTGRWYSSSVITPAITVGAFAINGSSGALPSSISNLVISYGTPAVGGAAISVTATGGSNVNSLSVFSSLSLINFRTGISFQKASIFTVANSYFYSTHVSASGVAVANSVNGDNGDSSIYGSTFSYSNAGSNIAVAWSSAGGLRFVNNKCTGMLTCVQVALASGLDTSDILVADSSIEGYSSSGVSVFRAGVTGGLWNLQVVDTEFSAGLPNTYGVLIPHDATGAWLTNVVLSGNIVRGPGSGTNYGFYVDSANGVNITGNVVTSGGAGTTTAVYIGSAVTNCSVAANQFVQATTNLTDVSGVCSSAPVTKTADFTVATNEDFLISNRAATNTATMPSASAFLGRKITVKTIQAQTVVSASSNVVPLVGGAAGTAILAATAGKWATMVSDGTNWVIMAGN